MRRLANGKLVMKRSTKPQSVDDSHLARELNDKSRSTAMIARCNVCGRHFDEASSLLIHARVHRKHAKSIRCTRGCIEHYYDSENELQAHLRHVHGIGVRGIVCYCCDVIMKCMCRNASLHLMHGDVQQRQRTLSTCTSAQGIASLSLSQRL